MDTQLGASVQRGRTPTHKMACGEMQRRQVITVTVGQREGDQKRAVRLPRAAHVMPHINHAGAVLSAKHFEARAGRVETQREMQPTTATSAVRKGVGMGSHLNLVILPGR